MDVIVRTAVVAIALIVIAPAANTRNNMPGIGSLWTNVKESVSDLFMPDANRVFAEQWSENYHGKGDDKKGKKREKQRDLILSPN